MAGTSTPQMAAAVTNAGALGSIAVGAKNAESPGDVGRRPDRQPAVAAKEKAAL
jgi:NAD(P)H-dependent flavin oxidoreductase YrpB (nitropropane dioxygenase family)